MKPIEGPRSWQRWNTRGWWDQLCIEIH